MPPWSTAGKHALGQGWCWNCPHLDPDTRSKTNDRSPHWTQPFCSPGTDSKLHWPGVALSIGSAERETTKLSFTKTCLGCQPRARLGALLPLNITHRQTRTNRSLRPGRPPHSLIPQGQTPTLLSLPSRNFAWAPWRSSVRGTAPGGPPLRRWCSQVAGEERKRLRTGRNTGLATNARTRTL